MPRFSWLFNATQAFSKNAKEKPRETKGEEGELSTNTAQKDLTRFTSIEGLSQSDDPLSWLTWLRKAADLQRKSRQSFYIDPPVIDIWNSSSSSLTNDPPTSRPEVQRSSTEPSSPKKGNKSKGNPEPLYDPSLAAEYNKAILTYISTGTVPKSKACSSTKSKKTSKEQQKSVRFELESTAAKEKPIIPKLNMQNSRIIFQSPNLTVILTPPPSSAHPSLQRSSTASKTPARYKSKREMGGSERRNPFLSIRNYRLETGSVDGLHTNTTMNSMTRNFPNRSSPNISHQHQHHDPPFGPADYHTFNPHLNTAQNPRFSTSSLHLTRSSSFTRTHLSPPAYSNTSPTHLHPNDNPTLTPYSTTTTPNLKPLTHRPKTQHETRELNELRTFMIEVLNREGGQLKKGMREKIMGLYGIEAKDLDLKPAYFSSGNTEGESVRDEKGEVSKEGSGTIDEGVDFGCEKEDLRSLEMVFRGRFSGGWDIGSGGGGGWRGKVLV